jgi:glycosyltransferase 2 family protein
MNSQTHATARPLWGRPLVRVGLQAGVSLVVIGILFNLARGTELAASFRQVSPGTLAVATGLLVLAYLVNSRRWQLLLRHADIHEPLPRLTGLYFIGQFCSLFLPTAAGGDAVRVYEVSRGGHSPWRALLATLQERLVGLGTTMGVGLVATLFSFRLLPVGVAWLILAMQTGGLLAVGTCLWPRGVLRLADWFASTRLQPLARLQGLVARLRDLPPINRSQVVPLLGLSLLSFLFNALIYVIVGQALGIAVGLPAYFLILPLVWVVRMLPVSLNGVGVGEGAFVFLAGLFGVSSGQALALALTILGVQTGVALFGGLLLPLRVARGASGKATTCRLKKQERRRAA